MNGARRALAGFLGAAPEEVGFGLNATAVNARMIAAAARRLRPGDEIVVTALDHQANVVPWQAAAADHGLVMRTAPVSADTRLDLDALAGLVGERTRVVAFPWASNAFGTIVDVAQVTRLAHAAGATAWADATHYLPHGPVHAHESGVDVIVGSAYKFFGPHLGVFYTRPDLARQWGPDLPAPGGPQPAAAWLEQGTLPFEALAGLTSALDYLADVGWELIQDTEQRLIERFLIGLPRPWQLHGIPAVAGRTATFALTLAGTDPRQLARDLARRDIAVSAGDLDCPAVMHALSLDRGVLRAGFLHYTTEAEIDTLLAALTDLAVGPAG